MSEDLATPEPAPPKAPATRWGIIALVVVAVLTVLGGATALILTRLSGAPLTSPSPRYVSCIQFGTSDKEYCDRFVDDIARRDELTQEQRDALEPDAKRAREAARNPALCRDLARGLENRQFAQCAGVSSGSDRGAGRAPTPADAEAIRLALEQAGFPGAVVRVARDNDPAPHGTILFAVPIGDACLLGYQAAGSGGGGFTLQGHLPGGRCLRD
ncbi:DUF6993 domain-containing protein [Dactylosporangium sp. CS-047395]|uniref:DUF6993 domain-containing protein n=1 Tax=Dactylosporangium sp. CS-047395 TaxID=3239936 RepID=UPI003D91E05B